MKYSKLIWIVVAAVVLLVGCNRVMNRRISAHMDTWSALSKQDQQRLMKGFVRRGDTQAMVEIALGKPDHMLPLSGPDGQRLTVWIYVDQMDNWIGPPSNETSSNRPTSSDRSIMFHDGIMVDRAATAVEDYAKLADHQVRPSVERMLERLDSLVSLAPEQKAKAYEIFAKAKEELLAYDLNESISKGMPIRVKMRADIRALLTPEQQAKYDDAPQRLGGGSTKRP